ncbi:MAG: aminopeptidase PepB [Psychrosphaera sp.]|nr:aminopeptidase PepB [Psychrosphaera sp.]
MTDMMKVKISSQAAPAHWGEQAILSADAEGFVIHTSDNNAETVQRAARKIEEQGIKEVTLVDAGWDVECQWAFVQGFTTPSKMNNVTWAEASKEDLAELNARRSAMIWTRTMVNETPEELSPVKLAKLAAEFIQSLAPEHVSFETIIGDELLENQWAGIHAVGRGSDRPPAMLILDYNPSGDANAPVDAALVGKGITFDSGGYSIKASEGMASMKCDMGGAATVTGGLALAIQRGLNKRIKLILCCAENLINGVAYKLGDILTYKNGTTVEVVNTDAEGRLVLADGLMAAGETGAPLVIDAATLTGAALVAVGTEYYATMALDKELQQRMLGYAASEKENAWALPLEKFHANNCPSAYADTANSRPQKGGGFGGASNAAGFLSRFVANEGKGWIHMDLASAFNNNPNGLWSAGASALGIRTIARAIADEG